MHTQQKNNSTLINFFFKIKRFESSNKFVSRNIVKSCSKNLTGYIKMSTDAQPPFFSNFSDFSQARYGVFFKFY